MEALSAEKCEISFLTRRAELALLATFSYFEVLPQI